MKSDISTLILLSAVCVAVGCSSNNGPAVPAAVTATPALYMETNALSGNAVLAYSRGTSGALTSLGSFATGGNGTGLPPTGLPFPIGGATGSVTLSPGSKYLYAVDAGTNDVAAFTVSTDGTLVAIGKYPTGGTSPASITVDPTGTYLYVLNTGTLPSGVNVAGGITGFTIGATGALAAIPGSTHALSVAQYVDPSEIAFSVDGSYLAVTEKFTNTIDIYPSPGGLAGVPVSSASTGSLPFGFEFTKSGTMVVANAESTTDVTAATLTSYTATAKGALTVISSRVPDTQGAACWVALTSDGAYAYATNTLSGTVSGYNIGTGGALTLLTAGGITASQPNTTGPIDDIVTPDNKFLYVLDSNAGKTPGTIAGFSIGTGGTLTSFSTNVSGLVPGSVGLAVR